jgi:hypothetical protein
LILRGQGTKMVGSEELSPAQPAPVLGAVAAQVPEVGGALKAPYAIWMAMHARLVHSNSPSWTTIRPSFIDNDQERLQQILAPVTADGHLVNRLL